MMTNLGVLLALSGLIGGLLFLAFLILKSSRKREGVLGLNFEVPDCPNCGVKQPFIRLPKSFRQAMFGGFTCANCGQVMDKWGSRVSNAE